jgi:hypothetical protein
VLYVWLLLLLVPYVCCGIQAPHAGGGGGVTNAVVETCFLGCVEVLFGAQFAGFAAVAVHEVLVGGTFAALRPALARGL